MKIIYSPAYQGFTYYNLNYQNNGIAIDQQICNTSGLLDLLEMYAGIHFETTNRNKRIADYYSKLLQYTEGHAGHLLSESFRLDSLGTAKTCLAWRDRLVEAGWCGQGASGSKRMEVLCGIEKLFDCPGNSERIINYIDHLKKGCTLPDKLEIETTCPVEFLDPTIQHLFELLSERGIKTCYIEPEKTDGSNLSLIRSLIRGEKVADTELKPNDNSFRILKFKQRQDAINWLTLQPATDYDVWIDSDNKAFDNTLRLSGQPACGSSLNDVIPQISQLLIIALNLIPQPLNIQFLLEWLRSPVNPLDKILREPLADTIVDSGGYYNKKCQEVLDNYLKGKYDFWPSDISEEDKQETIKNKIRDRKKDIKTYLPSMGQPDDVLKMDEYIKIADIKNCVKVISSWVKNRIHKNIPTTEQMQLQVIVEQADAINLLLEKENQETIPITKMQSWINSLYEPQDCPMYEAERNCRNVINSPACFASKSNKTIWCDFHNTSGSATTFAFLSLKEKVTLAAEGIKLWAADDERKYQAYLQQMPFLLTRQQLTLVVSERNGSEVLQKHPLMILLEQHFSNLSDFIVEPQIADSLYADPHLVDNKPENNFNLKLHNADLLKWRDKESATSLELLIQHPFDYTMKYLVGINDNSISSMMKLDKTKGLVAHNTIAQLFYKEGEKNIAEQISERVASSFDEAFSHALLEEGAILLLRENRVDTKILKDRLRHAIEALLVIIRDNALHVVDCEKEIIRKLQFDSNPDIKGYVDMILADEQNNLFVFDFKWTSSKSKYQGFITKNAALQLALYKELVVQELGMNVVATAYFLMPENHLYSTYEFKGDNSVQLEEQENVGKELFSQVKNSHKYRLQQLAKGDIELGECEDPSELQYYIDSVQKELMPLQIRDGVKADNIFSDYNSFRQ